MNCLPLKGLQLRHGAKFFTILDANKAFLQLKLSEGSSECKTFNTPFGVTVLRDYLMVCAQA